MARIAYGVHGTGHGHAMRALTVARHYPDHEFLLVTHGDGSAILGSEYRVVECPNPVTPVRFHKVDISALLHQNFKVFLKKKTFIERAVTIIEDFQPDAVISDYEFFLPRACRILGVPCLSLDHQHVVTACVHSVPWRQWYSYFSTYCAIKCLFSKCSDYIVTSFFRPPLRKNVKTRLVPPLLRESVIEVTPCSGEHVLAYHGYSTSKGFFDFLKTIKRHVIVYGSNTDGKDGNLEFKRNSEEGFLKDLASCCYVVCSGGNSLISESLFYGKPLLAFPIQNAFEQFLNCHYVETLGYGKYFEKFDRAVGAVESFEENLDNYRNNIGKGRFCGNDEIFSLIDSFVADKKIFSYEENRESATEETDQY
ncbi:glycosyltransferase family protein [Thermodesulfobacteriota bacterium]